MSTAFSILPPDRIPAVFCASVFVGSLCSFSFWPLSFHPSCPPSSQDTALGSLSALVFSGLLVQCVCLAAQSGISRSNPSWPCSCLTLPQCFLGMAHLSPLFCGPVLIPSPFASLCLFNYNLEFQERCHHCSPWPLHGWGSFPRMHCVSPCLVNMHSSFRPKFFPW